MILAIIGTAGRKDDEAKLTNDVWKHMKHGAYDFVLNNKNRYVTSGGAAYADHLAVILFNLGFLSELKLVLPCSYDLYSKQFEDSGEFDWKNNPGGTANFYHKQFSAKQNLNSLGEIADAFTHQNAKFEIEKGFKERNGIVARANVILAFTFGNKEKIKDGGTADTIRKHIDFWKTNKSVFHFNLNDMKLYDNAKV